MNLLDRVVAHLAAARIQHVLIGAAALAVHGISRSTADQDLLVLDRRVFDDDLWHAIATDAIVDIRRGDADDPLAGVVRISLAGERDVDLVVGRHRWQQEILDRATTIGDLTVRVVQLSDLVLLKLYAGGSQDRWDIEQLLAHASAADLVAQVDERAEALPQRCRDMWRLLRPDR